MTSSDSSVHPFWFSSNAHGSLVFRKAANEETNEYSFGVLLLTILIVFVLVMPSSVKQRN